MPVPLKDDRVVVSDSRKLFDNACLIGTIKLSNGIKKPTEIDSVVAIQSGT